MNPKSQVLVITTTHVFGVVEITDWRKRKPAQQQIQVRFDTRFEAIAEQTGRTFDEIIALASGVAVQSVAALLECDPSQLRAHQAVNHDSSLFVEAVDGGDLPPPHQERLVM